MRESGSERFSGTTRLPHCTITPCGSRMRQTSGSNQASVSGRLADWGAGVGSAGTGVSAGGAVGVGVTVGGAGTGVAVANWGLDFTSSPPHAMMRASAIRVNRKRRGRGIGIAFRVCFPIGLGREGRPRLLPPSAWPRCLRVECISGHRRRLRSRGSVQAACSARRRWRQRSC